MKLKRRRKVKKWMKRIFGIFAFIFLLPLFIMTSFVKWLVVTDMTFLESMIETADLLFRGFFK